MLRNFINLIAIVAIAMNLSGCFLLLAGAVGGAGTAYWLSGKLTDEVSASYEQAIEAAKKGLDDLDMTIDKETRSAEVTQIRSLYGDGSEVWVDVRPLTQESSKIEVRVGLKSDREAAVEVMDSIKNNL